MSEKERVWLKSIANGMAELNREAIHRAARRSPGENIEVGLDLSELASAIATHLERPDEVPPVSIWRQLALRHVGRA